MRAALGALALLLAVPPAAAGEKSKTGCTIQVGKDDQAAQGADLTVEAGRRVHHAVALHGNVILRKGADVDEVAALGGSVTLEAGAVARKALAVGGDVRVRKGARVDGDAVAFGGRVVVEPGAEVRGEHTDLDISLDGKRLGQVIREEIEARGHCTVEREL